LADQESTYAWYQQGDVTIKPVPKIPRRAVATGNRVLAEGETTGHKHVAESEDVSLFLHEETLFMRAPAGTTITHQNHQAIQVPPGDYVIGRVRKYDHFAEEDDDKFD
jgi:hypothetical protein